MEQPRELFIIYRQIHEEKRGEWETAYYVIVSPSLVLFVTPFIA